MKSPRFSFPIGAKSQTPLENAEWRARLFSTDGAAIALCASLVVLGAASAQAQRPLGVDVSDFQGTSINWTSVKGDGVSFAWSKSTQGASGQYVSQASFSGNISGGKAAGLYMGAYHFCEPWKNAPATEVSYFWSVAGGTILADGKTLMPMLDFEVFSGVTGASTYSAWMNDWCSDVVADAAANGVSVRPAIYSSAGTGACDLSNMGQWGADIANYNGESVFSGTPWSCCTGCEAWGAGVWNFWQVSDTGAISGISGHVDLDGFNGTAATLLSGWVATAANSPLYYWDPQGTSGANPYTGSMTGTWENAKWSTGSGGQATTVNWVDGKAAVFGVHTGTNTPAYTITMNSDHVVAGFFDGPLAPNSCDVTITGTGIIDLASGPQGLDAHNASDGSKAFIRINVPITGEGQLFPEDNGQSFLNATNTFTGGTTLGYDDASGPNAFSGIVNFNNGSAFGSGPITLWKWGTGGALALTGSAAATVPNAVSVTTATTNNFVGNAAGLTFSGNWSLGANLLTMGTGPTNTHVAISGVVSGTAGFTIYNPGTLILSGVNTYTGTTTITAPATLTIGGAGQLNSGTYANNIVNGGAFNYTSSAAQTISGVISGVGPLNVNGGGALVLSGVNTYTGGTTISGLATVGLNADSGLGGSTIGVTLNGGCIKNNNSSPTLGSGRTITLGASGGYFDAGWAPSHPLTISSKLTGAGALLINLDGSPVVLANTGNNYTGNTIIGTNGPSYFATGTAAWLQLGASGVIPNGTGAGDVYVYQAYAGLLDLAGFTETINGLNGDGTVDNTTAGNGSLTVGANNVTSTFNGVIQNTAGTLALTKSGTGTLTLGGTNTYTGATTVSAGTLALNGGSIGNSAVTVASAATLANDTTSAALIGGPTTLSAGAQVTLTMAGTPGKISVAGDLALNNTALTINDGSQGVSPGTYRLLDCTGNLTGVANPTATFTGLAPWSGYTVTVQTTAGAGGHVDLVVTQTAVTPTFANLTSSPSLVYGTPGVLLSGTVSAPVQPAKGEIVSVTINSNLQTTTINDSLGDFSLNYNLAGIPASGTPYPITYSYGGDANLSPSSNTSTALTVNAKPVAVTGTRAYDGSNDVAAAILTVTNAVGSDVVNVASGSGTLTSANVGAETISSFGTLALSGAAAGNYTLAGASGQVTVSTPPFAIISSGIDVSGTNFIITWQSAPGASYHVISTNNPSAPLATWPTVAGPIIATDTNTSVTNPMTSPASVFDVISP